jgi:amino acid transporter
MSGLRRELRLWDLVLLNVVAITGLRWWLTSAREGGYGSLPLWILAFLCFFVPSGLAVVDLTTRYPQEGGIYVWTKRAFGDGHGFIAGWCLWTNNLIYFPHLLIFTVGNLIFMAGPEAAYLEHNAVFVALLSLALFWITIWMNVRGLQYGRWLNNLGAVGTWVPAMLLIGLGSWALVRFGAATPFEPGALAPVLGFGTVAFFAQICFAFSGLEVGSMMSEEIVDPRRNVPRAVMIAGAVITLIYVLGTWSLLVVLPQESIDILSGVGAAVAAAQEKMGIGWLAAGSALLIALGGLGQTSAWLAGASRMPFVAGIDRYLPPVFGRVHPRHGSPYVAILATGGISSLLILVGFVGVSVEEAYLFLVDFTIVVYFIPYLYLFASLMRLGPPRAGESAGVIAVPGGRFGNLLAGLVGFLTTAVAIAFSFKAPQGANPAAFAGKILGGCALLLFAGWLLYRRGRRAA